MGIAALATGLLGLVGAGVAAHSAEKTQAANAAAQADINEKTMAFNRVEAEKARTFSDNQRIAENAFNAQQAEIARQFTERLSSTAHQREMYDLRAAGLNPILAANSGSASPVAAVASGHLGSSAQASVGSMSAYQKQNVMGSFVSSAMEAMRLNNDFKRVEIDAAKADISKTEAETHRMDADSRRMDAETNRARQETDSLKVRAEIDRINNDIEIAIKDLGIREELKNASVEEKHALIGKLMSDINLNSEMAAKIGMEKEELERRIRYGTLLSNYLPLEAREIVGEHMIDFVRDNKDIIKFFVDNMNGNYELSEEDGSRLWKKCLSWMVKKGYLKDSK